MSIGGYSNNFNATIDGLNNFVLDDLVVNTLVVNDTITLPNASILDNYLTTNIPKKNANNNFTGDNDYSGLITFQNGGDYKCNIFAISNLFSFTNNNLGGTIEFFCNTLTTADLVSPLSMSYTGLTCDSITQNINKVITQSGSSGSNTFKAFSVLANQSITQSGSGIVSQSGTGVNLLKAITIQVDNNISQSGTGIVSQSGTGVNLLKAITIQVDNNLLQSGTGIVSQSGTGVNLLKAITLQVNNNLSQSGTGIVSQSGTGINALKSCDVTGNLSIKSANSLLLYNSANTFFTQIFQSGTTLKFSNTSNPSQYTFEAYDGFGNLYTYTIGSSFTSGGDIVCNTTSLTLKDSTSSTTNLTQSGGNCNIQNTKQSGSIILTTQDATTNTRNLTIAYTGVSVPSLLTCNNGFTLSSGSLTLPNNSVSDSALSSNIPKLNTANTFSALLTCSAGFTLSAGTLTLPNNSVSDSALSSNIVKLTATQTLTNKTLDLPTITTKTIFSGGVGSSCELYLSSGNVYIDNANDPSVLGGTTIFRNQDNFGVNTEILKFNNTTITANRNITLPTTGTAPTTGQLGYIDSTTLISTTNTTMVSNTIYFPALITLGYGVWNITLQIAFRCNTAGTITGIEWGISTSSTAFENKYYERQLGGTGVINTYYVKTLTRVVSITTTTNFYALVRVVFSSGAFSFGNTSGTDTYVLISAVRIA